MCEVNIRIEGEVTKKTEGASGIDYFDTVDIMVKKPFDDAIFFDSYCSLSKEEIVKKNFT